MSNRWNVLPFALLFRLMANISIGICASSFHYFQCYSLSSCSTPLRVFRSSLRALMNHALIILKKGCVVRLVRCIVLTIECYF
jgi:hypothetical protein